MTQAELRKSLIPILRKEIGTREIGTTNTGKRVQLYQAATTLGGTGWPWCSAFFCFGLKKLSADLKLKRIIEWSYSASVDVVLADARKRNLLRDKPLPGMAFVVRAKRRDGTYSKTDGIHTGLVEDVRGNYFDTIEGNTNLAGGREGVAVMDHTRPISERFYFIDWAAGADIALPVLPTLAATPEWIVSLSRPGQDKKQFTCPAIDGRTYLPTRAFASYYGLSVSWDALNGTAIVGGHEVSAQPRLENGSSSYPVRALADLCNLQVAFDTSKRRVEVTL